MKECEPAAGAPALLGQRRGVDVGIEADRHAKRGARGAGDRDVRPAGLRRRGDLSVGRRISPQIHRPEGGDTDRGERPLPILFRRQEIQRLLERPLRRGRRESRLGTDVVWPRADKADELRAACFDRTKGLRHHGSAAYFRRDSAVNGSLDPASAARPYLIGTASTSAPTHWPGLLVLVKNSSVKFAWQSTHAVWKVLLSGTERR